MIGWRCSPRPTISHVYALSISHAVLVLGERHTFLMNGHGSIKVVRLCRCFLVVAGSAGLEAVGILLEISHPKSKNSKHLLRCMQRIEESARSSRLSFNYVSFTTINLFDVVRQDAVYNQSTLKILRGASNSQSLLEMVSLAICGVHQPERGIRQASVDKRRKICTKCGLNFISTFTFFLYSDVEAGLDAVQPHPCCPVVENYFPPISYPALWAVQ